MKQKIVEGHDGQETTHVAPPGFSGFRMPSKCHDLAERDIWGIGAFFRRRSLNGPGRVQAGSHLASL